MDAAMFVKLLVTVLLLACLSRARPALVDNDPTGQECALLNSNDTVYLALDAYKCLQSTTFDPATATLFLKYFKDTLQFHSTTAYLKDPPVSYQQPAVDLWGGLDKIQENVYASTYRNEYEFEADLQSLIYKAHDTHLWLDAGALSAFKFGSPIRITMISPDGKSPPKVYMTADLLDAQKKNSTGLPAAVVSINGQDVVQYLKEFATKQSIGNLEPHADWNQLMSASIKDVTGDITGDYSLFEAGITFHPGETLTIVREDNHTEGPEPFLAIYNDHGPTGPLVTGGDFYNFFVLGLFPRGIPHPVPGTNDKKLRPRSQSKSNSARLSHSRLRKRDDSEDDSDQDNIGLLTGWADSAFPPQPDVIQADLGVGGWITGYFLKDKERAILSIPSFVSGPQDIETFSQAIADFINNTTEAGMTKVIIDLQANGGGNYMLAIDAFKQFFPSVEPYTASRLRANDYTNALGKAFNNYYDTHPPNNSINSEYYRLIISEFVATVRHDLNGKNISSWEELYGPNSIHGDSFTGLEEIPLNSFVFDVLYSGGIDIHGYPGSEPSRPDPPFSSDDIMILTDGLCGSSCGVFVDLMQQRGVKTVVAGGLPQDGPMQAVGGTRGSEQYDYHQIDNDFALAPRLDSSLKHTFPNRTQPIWVVELSVNLRDQFRLGNDEPLQFKYQPASCRIYYTFDTFNNYTNLWNRAADAIWIDQDICVKGSTGHPYDSTPGPSGISTQIAKRQDQSAIDSKGFSPEAILGRAVSVVDFGNLEEKAATADLRTASVPEYSYEEPANSKLISSNRDLHERAEAGDSCTHHQLGRKAHSIRRSNPICLEVPLCNRTRAHLWVDFSSFKITTGKETPPNISQIPPWPHAYRCSRSSKCIPDDALGAPTRVSNPKSVTAIQWVIHCYCQLPSQICPTTSSSSLGLEHPFGQGIAADGFDAMALGGTPKDILLDEGSA
ncbi:MAG: hypothetical protein Q9165_001254 [Trypethelium subeluteriae]